MRASVTNQSIILLVSYILVYVFSIPFKVGVHNNQICVRILCLNPAYGCMLTLLCMSALNPVNLGSIVLTHRCIHTCTQAKTNAHMFTLETYIYILALSLIIHCAAAC